MGLQGPEFYDDNAVFNTYQMQRENRRDSPNDALEKPIFDELTGNLANLRILDLGCGNAKYGVEALQQGCRAYLGIEGSRNMFGLAEQTLAGSTGQVVQATIEGWDYPKQQFDLVTARLSLHYVADIDTLFTNVFNALADAGRFIFSVEHPVITSSDSAWRTGGPRQHWIVDDYFTTGARVTTWMGGEVIKYHRTVEDYFIGLQKAGFTVTSLRESRPQREHFHDQANYERRMRIPLMLFFSATRSSTRSLAAA